MRHILLGVLKAEKLLLYLFQRRQTLTSTLGLLGLSRSRKSSTLSSSSVIVKTLLQGNRAPLMVALIVPVIEKRFLVRMGDEEVGVRCRRWRGEREEEK